MTSLLWSSIDNDDSRDLDQIEWAERTAVGIRVLVAIADVDAAVAKGTPIDAHASHETTTVYAGVRNFPMLPERLSTDLTSLSESGDRAVVVIDMLVAADGSISSGSVYRAVTRNHAQLTYNAVGPWLEGTGAAPAKLAAAPDLQAQLKRASRSPRPSRRPQFRSSGNAGRGFRRAREGRYRPPSEPRVEVDRRLHDRRQ
jgi:exoribonuclease-2